MARQVLPIAGAIVGGFFGQPQLGWAIGSIIGNAVDPVVIKGPKIGEAGVQTSAEGVYRPIVYGTASVKGNIIARGNRRIRREESGGKGGPVTETERVSWTFAIRICEGPITGLLRIWQDEKLVYDVRAGTALAAESERFAESFTLYLGGEDQLPDADLEAYRGAGDVSAYRGSAYIVFPNFDLTDQRERIPDFRFEVSREIVTTPPASWFVGPVYNEAQTATGIVRGHTPATLGEFLPIPSFMTDVLRISSANGALFLHGSTEAAVSFDRGISFTECSTTIDDGNDVFWNGSAYYCKDKRSTDGITWFALTGIPDPIGGSVARATDGLIFVGTNTGGATVASIWYGSDGVSWTQEILATGGAGGISGDLMATDGGRLIYTGSGSISAHYTDDVFNTTDTVDPVIFRAHYGAGGNWLARANPNRLLAGDGATFDTELFASLNLGATADATVAYGDGWWAVVQVTAGTPTSYTIRAAQGITAFPAVDLYYSDSGVSITYIDIVQSSGTVGDYDRIALSSVVADLHERAGHTSADYNVAALTDQLVGLVLTNDFSYADAIRTLMPVYFFDCAEFDSGTGYRVHYVKRGGEPVASLTVDDLIEAPDKAIRNDALEYPLKLHLAYENPTVGYAAAKATARRSSPDLNVVGEVSVSVPVVFDLVDEPTQIADKLLKTQWAEAGGTEEFAVGEEWLSLVPTDNVTVTFRDQTRRMRIERQRIEQGQIVLELILDRKAALESNVTGVGLPAPTPPMPSIEGQTNLVWMNLPPPSGNFDNGVPEYYIAVGGYLPGWRGAQVQRSLDAGATWESIISAPDWSLIGTVSAFGTGTEYAFDRETEITVTFSSANPSYLIEQYLINATTDELQKDRNAIVVQKADSSEPEIIQFTNATQVSANVWTLSGLTRGLKNTTARAHTGGEQIVFLASAYVYQGEGPGSIGASLTFRAISTGNTVDGATQITRTFSPARSLQEFAPSLIPALDLSASDLSDLGTSINALFPSVLNPVPPLFQQGRYGTFVFLNLEVNGRLTDRRFTDVSATTARVIYTSGATSITRTVSVGRIDESYDSVNIPSYYIQDKLTDAEQTAAFGSVPGTLDVSVSLINATAGPGVALEFTI